MSRAFAVGDKVGWIAFFGKTEERGTIESVDYPKGLMMIYMETVQNSHGDCKISYGARKRKGKWYAFRDTHDYLDLLYRLKD